MSKKEHCAACALYNRGGKSRIAIEHTCGLQEPGILPDREYSNLKIENERLKKELAVMYSLNKEGWEKAASYEKTCKEWEQRDSKLSR